MVSERHRHRARLAARPVLAHDCVAVAATRDHDAGGALVVDLYTVRASVDPAGVRVAHDDQAACADVVSAVILMPARRCELAEVDSYALGDVVQDRPAAYRFIWHASIGRAELAPFSDHLELGQTGIEPAADRHSCRRGEDVAEHPPPGCVARYGVEQNGRIARLLHEDVN